MAFGFKTIYKKKATTKRAFIITVFGICILQLITALICLQTILAEWSSIVASWPYEITYCCFIGVALVFLKICQLLIMSTKAYNKERPVELFLTMPCVVLLGCAAFSCGMVKVRYCGRVLDQLKETSEEFVGSNKEETSSADIFHMISMAAYDSVQSSAKAWDTVQQKYKCCGSSSPSDWSILRQSLPKSCCPGSPKYCSMDESFLWGCGPILNQIIYEKIQCLEVTIYVIMVLELIAFFFMCVATLKKNKENAENSDISKKKISCKVAFLTPPISVIDARD